MNYIEITKTNIKQIKELSQLATKIVKEHYDPILGETQNDYMIDKFQSTQSISDQLKQGYKYFFVGDNDRNRVGFIAYYLRENDLYLSKFYLEKNKRGKGISRDMLQFIIKKTREADLQSIVLNVNKYNEIAIRAYETLGFVKIDEEKNDIGKGYYMDDFVYEYKID